MQTLKPFALNPDHIHVVEDNAPFSPLPRAQTGCLVLFFSAFLFVGALLGVGTVLEWLVLGKFQNTGVNTQATVLDHYVSNFRNIKSHYLYIGFEANGQTYENRVQVTEAQFIRYQVGDAAPIRYLPDDPTVLSVDWDNTTPPSFQWILTISTIIFNITIIGLLVTMLAQYRTILKLALGGEMLTGEILQATCSTTDNANFKLTIRYRFQAPTGKMLNGQASQTRNDLKHMPQRGTPVCVYYRNEQTYIML